MVDHTLRKYLFTTTPRWSTEIKCPMTTAVLGNMLNASLIGNAPLLTWLTAEQKPKSLNLSQLCFLFKVSSFFRHSNVLQFSNTGSWMLPTAPLAPFPTLSCTCSKGSYLLLGHFIKLHQPTSVIAVECSILLWYLWTTCFPVWKCLSYLESPRRHFNSWPFGHMCNSRSLLILFP